MTERESDLPAVPQKWNAGDWKSVKEILREAENRLTLALTSSHMGVWEWDAKTNEVFWSPESCEILGSEDAGRTIESFANLLHPEDAPRAIALIGQVSAVNPSFKTEFRIIRPDGEVRWVTNSGQGYFDEAGALLRMIGIVQDITERKHTEEALRASEERFKSYFELGLIGMVLSSPTKGTLEVNDEVCEMLGYERNELLQMTFAQVTHPDDLAANLALANRLLAREIDGYSLDKRFIRKDGRLIYATVSVKCVRRADGSIDYIVSLVQDITERRRLEDQLRQAQKMEAVGTLAGGVAHDFNNLLFVIMGCSNLIQERLGKDDHLRPHIDQIIASSEKAADLTQRLLAFSRKKRITLEPRNMNDIVKGTAKLLKRLLPEDIELKLDLTDADVIAHADVSEMDQVFMNLATNARDAMPGGGSLIIKTEVSTLGEDFYKVHGFGTPGRYVVLSVSDSGLGMDRKTITRIFDPFFTTKEVGRGTGLGLASVYGTVKQHGGYITVSSEPNQGTSFRIYLPLVDVDAPHEQESAHVEKTVKGTETILVAEDDPDVRIMLAKILESHGYVVMQAVDGEDAISVCNENRIDLVILDVVMPRKNGKEAYDEIARTGHRVKAIFVSGYTGNIVIDKGVRSESVDFIQKPVSAPDLLSKVREVLDR